MPVGSMFFIGALMALNPAPPLTVWLAGDSTVAQGGSVCPRGWGAHFKEYFNDQVTVNNYAAGGRSVRTWLYEVKPEKDKSGECELGLDAMGQPMLQARWQTTLSGMRSGDYIFIQFGINDASATCDRHVGVDAFKQSYGMMAQAAKDRGAYPIFLTPLSAIACMGSTARGTRGDYVTAVQQAGLQYGVPVIDLHQMSVNLYNSLGFCPVAGGDVSSTTSGSVGDFFCNDHTHTDEKGAEVIAGLLADALVSQGIGLAAYRK